MKRNILPLIGALAVGLVGGAILMGTIRPGADEVGGGESAATAWTCSMHPQIQQPKAGKCPICAMDLIPVGTGSGDPGERRFAMSAAARELARIETVVVERRYPEAEVLLFGKVGYDETRLSTLAARFPGRIDRLYVDYTGIAVREGDHLARVYSPELLTAQSELLTAKRFGNESGLAAARDKFRLWGFSEEKIAALEGAAKPSDQLDVDAPAEGVVVEKDVKEGDYVTTGQPLFRIAQLDRVWVMLQAYESDLPWLRFGQRVEFETEALPGRVFEGQIAFLSPELDGKTRTVTVRVNVENPERALKPGMFVRAVVRARIGEGERVMEPSLAGKWVSPMHPEIVKDGPGVCDICGMDLVPAEEFGYTTQEDGEAPLVVAASAVLHTGRRSVVYVEVPDAEEPTYEGRVIRLGPRAGEVFIVEAGLREGERVVAQGAFKIDSALQIQAKASMMNPGELPEVPFAVDAAFTAALEGFLGGYFALQEELAADDAEAAEAAAQALPGTAIAVEAGGLEAEAGESWSELMNEFEKAARVMAEAEGLEGKRDLFEPLSKVVEEMTRRFGEGLENPVYVMHCPMALGNVGADWMQRKEELVNPYFGARMLRCGTVTERLGGANDNAAQQEHEHESL